MTNAAQPGPTDRHQRRWPWWLAGTVGALILVGVICQPLLGGFVRKKLVATVESRLNAELRVGTVTYLPPYGVRVRDVAFVVQDEGEEPLEMVTTEKIDLKLAKLPIGGGPLVIERLTIDEPRVHLIKTEHGLMGMDGLVRPGEKKRDKPKRKLSEMFLLRHFKLTGGEVVYEDRTQPGSLPVVWRDLNVTTNTEPAGQGVYAYDFAGSNGELASMKSTGTVNVDSAVLDAKSLKMNVAVDRAATESAVPAELQKIFRQYGIQGKLALGGGGTVPLTDLPASRYQLDLALDDGSGRIPGYGRPIDKLTARVRVAGREGEAISSMVALEAVSGPDVLHVDDGQVAVDTRGKRWDLKKLDLRVDSEPAGVRPFDSKPTPQEKMRASGALAVTAEGTGPLEIRSFEQFLREVKFEVVATATDFRTQPPGWPAPVHLVTGAPILVNQDVVRLENLTGRYGSDTFVLTTLRVPLRDLPRVIRVEQLSASVTFDNHTPPYPGKVGELLKRVSPVGPFEVGGNLTYDRDGGDRKVNYHVLLHTEQGALTIRHGGREIPVTRINAEVLADPGAVRVGYLNANLFGGLLDAKATVNTGGDQIEWQAAGSLRDFDLRDAVQTLTGKPYETDRLAGRVFLNFDAAGGKTPASVRATGDVEMYEGRLFEVPVLADVLGRSGLGQGMVGSEAAATFAVADERVRVRQAAVGAPAIGVQGYGTVGFDKSLDLRVTVAPLGQWKERFQQTGIPVVGNVLGEVAGVIQGAVNTAASVALYQFHVTGDAGNPAIAAIPAPALTEGAAVLFGAMLTRDEKGQGPKLSEQVKKTAADAADDVARPARWEKRPATPNGGDGDGRKGG